MGLLEQVQKEGSPLIDGEMVTFLWQGTKHPQLIADFNGWEKDEGVTWSRAGKGLWKVELRLPADAYAEYAFTSDEDNDTDPAHLLDPCNRNKIANGLGKMNNFFYMPGALPTPFTRVRRSVRRGQVITEVVEGGPLLWNRKRKVHFYRPPVDGPCPLVVVWDGQDYLRRARLPAIVDNLIHLGRIHPIALAMIEHGGPARMVEYGCNETTLGYLLERVLPAAGKHLDLLDLQEHPGSYGVIGASMSGLMTLYTGLRAPAIFGHLLPQSGAFTIGEFRMVVWDLVQSIDPSLLKIWMDAGSFEYLAVCNREMASLLEERGFDGHYCEYSGGHNYTCWRNDLANGLEFLYGD
jgi:enterochelin esterase family protein